MIVAYNYFILTTIYGQKNPNRNDMQNCHNWGKAVNIVLLSKSLRIHKYSTNKNRCHVNTLLFRNIAKQDRQEYINKKQNSKKGSFRYV